MNASALSRHSLIQIIVECDAPLLIVSPPYQRRVVQHIGWHGGADSCPALSASPHRTTLRRQTGPRAPRTVPMARYDWLRAAVLDWFDASARSMPWRGITDPYAILVAEVMLQQTQVDRVIPAYLAFLARFPTLQSLAHAPRAQVIRAWAGLGYKPPGRQPAARSPGGVRPLRRTPPRRPGGAAQPSRHRRLHGRRGGPASPTTHRSRSSTTNVRRVLGRFFFGQDWAQRNDRELRALAEAALPAGRAWHWNQALMDLGATVCPARAPRCSACPLESPVPGRSTLQGWRRSAARPRVRWSTRRGARRRTAPRPRASTGPAATTGAGPSRFYEASRPAPPRRCGRWGVPSGRGSHGRTCRGSWSSSRGLQRDGLLAVAGAPPDLTVSLPED